MNRLTQAKLLLQLESLNAAYNATNDKDARRRIKKARRRTLWMLDRTIPWKLLCVALVLLLCALSVQTYKAHLYADAYADMAQQFCEDVTKGNAEACRNVTGSDWVALPKGKK